MSTPSTTAIEVAEVISGANAADVNVTVVVSEPVSFVAVIVILSEDGYDVGVYVRVLPVLVIVLGRVDVVNVIVPLPLAVIV